MSFRFTGDVRDLGAGPAAEFEDGYVRPGGGTTFRLNEASLISSLPNYREQMPHLLPEVERALAAVREFAKRRAEESR